MPGEFRDHRHVAAHPLEDQRVDVRKVAFDQAKKRLDRPGWLGCTFKSLDSPHLKFSAFGVCVHCVSGAIRVKIGTVLKTGQGRAAPQHRYNVTSSTRLRKWLSFCVRMNWCC